MNKDYNFKDYNFIEDILRVQGEELFSFSKTSQYLTEDVHLIADGCVTVFNSACTANEDLVYTRNRSSVVDEVNGVFFNSFCSTVQAPDNSSRDTSKKITVFNSHYPGWFSSECATVFSSHFNSRYNTNKNSHHSSKKVN